MPSYCCRWPTCTVYLPAKGYCPEHAEQGRREQGQRHQYYDQHVRNPESKEFYNSAAWQRARRTKLATTPWCERCRKVWAAHVHHVVPVKVATLKEKLDQRYLVSVCAACHNAIEAEVRAQGGST